MLRLSSRYARINKDIPRISPKIHDKVHVIEYAANKKFSGFKTAKNSPKPNSALYSKRTSIHKSNKPINIMLSKHIKIKSNTL